MAESLDERHREAMRLCEEADGLRIQAWTLFEQAALLEQEVADQVDKEPARSILQQSAANIRLSLDEAKLVVDLKRELEAEGARVCELEAEIEELEAERDHLREQRARLLGLLESAADQLPTIDSCASHGPETPPTICDCRECWLDRCAAWDDWWNDWLPRIEALLGEEVQRAR